MRDSTVTLHDGRTVGVAAYGTDNGPVLLYCHGAPTSRLDLVAIEPALDELVVRALALDRPGYGESSPDPGRTIERWSGDALEVLDGIGVERFGVLGVSSGAPYALALAATAPDRVGAVAVIGGVTDYGWPGAWAGTSTLEAQLMQHEDRDEVLTLCAEAVGDDGSGFLDASGDMPAPDMALFADDAFAAAMIASMGAAFAQGIVGYADDMLAQGAPWRFDVHDIACPVDVHHGELDTISPFAHAQHNAEIIGTAELRTWPGHGHISLLTEARAILAPVTSELR